MLQALQSHFREMTPKALPIWEQYLNALNYQRDELKRRYMLNYGGNSRCVQVLKHILSLTDMDHLNLQKNDYDRYLNSLRFYRNSFKEIFDPVKNGCAYRKVFYDKKLLYSTSEYLCPIDTISYPSILPFQKNWYAWEKVKPVHIWYHNSEEYTLNFLKNSIAFKTEQPTHGIIFIDTISLIFKYYKYLMTDLPNEPEKTMHNFIHRHVLNTVFEDLEEIWLLNQILLCASIEDNAANYKDISLIQKISDRQYGYITSRHEEAMNEILRAFKLIRTGQLRVNSFLSAKIFPSGSILDRIEYSFKYLDVPHLIQYQYMEIMRDLPLLKLIITLYSWRPETVMYKALCRDLRILTQRIQNTKPWLKIFDSSIKGYIQQEMDKLYEKVTYGVPDQTSSY